MNINTAPSISKIDSFEEEMSAEPWYHFSIDDVFDALVEVNDKKISLLEHPTFSFLEKMHKAYGLHVGLNLFFQKKINHEMRYLSEIRDMKEEIKSLGGWLKFAPHALDFETAPYDQKPEDQIGVFDKIYSEITRSAGQDSYARSVRLHYYSESYELASYFKEKGVQALFATDRPSGAHRLPQDSKDDLLKKGFTRFENLYFIRTHFRIEFFEQKKESFLSIKKMFEETLGTHKHIVLYTHEYELARKEILETLEKSLKVLKSIHVPSINKM